MKKILLTALIAVPILALSQTVIIDEKFDSYSNLDYAGAVSPIMTTWSGATGAGSDDCQVVSAQFSSFANSITITGPQAGGTTDAMVVFPANYTTGTYEYSMKYMVGPGMGGYFNLQSKGDVPGTAWMGDFFFAADGTGSADVGGQSLTFAYTNGAWIDFKVVCNLDIDSAHVWVAGVELGTGFKWSLESGGVGTGANNSFGGLNLYSLSGDPVANCEYFVDDIMLIETTCTPSSSSQTLVECTGYSITVGTNTYSTTGVYTDILASASGCDSTVTTDLTINSASSSSQTLVECPGYSITVGTNTYSTTGVYTDILASASGCDSTVTTDLTINSVDTAVTQSGAVLTANVTGAVYQWVDCDNGFSAIVGDTNQTFTANANGNFAVTVTENGCTVTSACYNVSGVGINELEAYGLSIYPNPSNGTFFIETTIDQLQSISIIDNLGRIVYQLSEVVNVKNEINIESFGEGIYFIKVTGNAGTVTKTLVITQ
ncbi:MAG: T9SS type A sorting domain-containing protein [Flavobacteriales bacterium]|nr:T9SS type A sorting domain-containing protein [Flavobacteriales bacterium]